ncbi:MAG: hypothetical protein P8X82_19635 [Gemmatimonadales bacterium]|jgi:hypothetical protein
MTSLEPELITIIEGPTPDFQPTPQRWLQSVHEGPEDQHIALCQLRTMNGESILERCQNAWQDGRLVKLDFPDRLRLRQQVDVVAIRLQEREEGAMLLIWVALPIESEEEEGMGGEDAANEDDDEQRYW